jgi:hypothetical protein
MATRMVSFYTLVCDGCQKQFGIDIKYGSNIEARAAAYTQGWRFPERVRARGGESKTVSDVCPDCEPAFERQPAPNNWANRRKGRAGNEDSVA